MAGIRGDGGLRGAMGADGEQVGAAGSRMGLPMPGGDVFSYARTRLEALLGPADAITDSPPGRRWRCGKEAGSIELELWGENPSCPTLRLRGDDRVLGRLAGWKYVEMSSPQKVDWVMGALAADHLCATRRAPA